MKPSTHSLASIGIAALVAWAVILTGCQSDAPETAEEGPYQIGAPIDDSTYALIIESEFGGDTLTTERFELQIMNFAQRAPRVLADPTQRQQLYRGLAEDFIRRHLIEGEADRLGVQADPALVEEQISLIQTQFDDPAAFEQALAAQNLTLDSLRSVIAVEVRLQTMQEQMLEAAAEPTAAELEAFREEQAQQVRAQHILFRVPDAEQEDAVIEQAEAVLDSIKAGADFAAMAARYGTDGTAQNGGDLGFFSKKEMVAPFSDAAFALSDSGDVARDLVKTSFGYHIIRLTGRRTNALMDSTRAQAMLMQERQQEAFDNAYDALRKKTTIRLNPDVLDVDLNETADS